MNLSPLKRREILKRSEVYIFSLAEASCPWCGLLPGIYRLQEEPLPTPPDTHSLQVGTPHVVTCRGQCQVSMLGRKTLAGCSSSRLRHTRGGVACPCSCRNGVRVTPSRDTVGRRQGRPLCPCAAAGPALSGCFSWRLTC